jgi:hypothetical protein
MNGEAVRQTRQVIQSMEYLIRDLHNSGFIVSETTCREAVAELARLLEVIDDLKSENRNLRRLLVMWQVIA